MSLWSGVYVQELNMQPKRQTSLLERPATTAAPTNVCPHAGYALNIALVYQDAPTREWAGQLRDLMANLVGENALRCTEWDMSHLRQAEAFRDGVVALSQADIIVIAVHEAERLPSQFYLWVNLWLQQRSGRSGALVALIDSVGEPSSDSRETRRYLNAVANQGRLELFLKECDLSSEPVSVPREELLQWAKSS
jgi:hypothetical protein